MLKVSTTYETWDEEAMAAGETDDKGYELENEALEFRDLVHLFKTEGFSVGDTVPSLYSWYSTSEEEIDFRTGEQIIRAIHFSDIPRKRKYFDLAFKLAFKPSR